MDTLTPRQIKTLTLFSYNCRGHGADEVVQYQYMEGCEINTYETNWHVGYGDVISGYDAIDRTIQDIIESNELYLKGDGRYCENYGYLKLSIDCVERNITINSNQDEFSLNEMYKEINQIDNEDILKFFEYMNDQNFNKGTIEFNGSGDDGEIDNTILFDDKFSKPISSNIFDFLYEQLEDFYAGWEMNEGGYGNFVFNKEGNIQIYFNERREDSVDLGRVFYAEF